MGAVGFITKGADVMAPGITDADPMIQKDDLVWICDEKHRKPIGGWGCVDDRGGDENEKTRKSSKNTPLCW